MRAHQSPPRIPVPTRYGTIDIVCWGDSIRLFTPEKTDSEGKRGFIPLKINSVEYMVDGDLRANAETGVFELKTPTYNAIRLQKYNSVKYSDWSHSALEKAKEEFPRAINAYLADHPQVRHEGYLIWHNNQVRSAEIDYLRDCEKANESKKVLDSATDAEAKYISLSGWKEKS